MKKHGLLFLKGMAMGAADVVPGVSGGTIAFISGIYDELLLSIKNLQPSLLVVLWKEGFGAFWQQANATFLLVLFAGLITSVFTLATLVEHLLVSQPVLIWSFFFGLIIASIIFIVRQQQQWHFLQFAGLAVGAVLAAGAVFSPTLTVEAHYLSFFLAGAIAICAMILPGVSGSFLLLLMGLYPEVISAITELKWGLLLCFACGAGLGLMAFSRVLSWLLTVHRHTTLAVLVGFLVGSLAMVWPWKNGQEGSAGELLSPMAYQQLVGDSHIIGAVLLMMLALVVVLGLEHVGQQLAKAEASRIESP